VIGKGHARISDWPFWDGWPSAKMKVLLECPEVRGWLGAHGLVRAGFSMIGSPAAALGCTQPP
jgi:hypothetical protein